MNGRMIIAVGVTALLLIPPAIGQDGRRRGDRGWDRERGSEERFEGRRGRRGRFGDGPPGRGGFDPVSRLDANGNGVIDQEEIDRIPGRFRDVMEERGFHLERGESVDSVRGRMRERFERAREERDRRDREEEDRMDDSGRANRSTPPPAFRPRDRERMTADLPKSWVELDTDLDGQLGLYEWIVARRSELELFDQIDRNSDGLLTPGELVAWDAVQAAGGRPTLTVKKRERLVIVGNAPTTTDAPGRSTGQAEQNDERERTRRDADRIFGRLDRDRDGTVSVDEFRSSRRMRPWFEAEGVEIRSMTQQEFQSIYERLSRTRSRGERSRR